ncbi:MAG: anti-sigma factor antagonist [Lachnospiraceae bacterium]|nr:anti-sigma factor antagonist [Lachnospiraceae bacterium]
MDNTTYSLRDRVLFVKLTKELDHHNAIGIRYTADELLNQKQCDSVVFDFANTVFMDSSGIGVIMGRYRKVREIGGFIGVTGVGESINRILEISGMYKLVKKIDMGEMENGN